MKCTILKSFPYSDDGVTAKMAKPGEIEDIPDNLVDGLMGAEFIEVPSADELKKAEAPAKPKPAAKDAGASKENKALGNAKENK